MTLWSGSNASLAKTAAERPWLSAGMAGNKRGQLSANPGTLRFGRVGVGQSASLITTLTNTQVTSVTISDLTESGVGFSAVDLSLPLTLEAGQSVPLSVTFSPQAGGRVTASIVLTSDASNTTLLLNLQGVGVTSGTLAGNPPSLSFGQIAVGTTQTLPETLTNSGAASVTVTQITTTSSQFSLSGLSLPLTLLPAQSFTFGAVFAPLSGGNASDSITVISNASNSTLSIPLAGTGVAAGQLAVTPAELAFGDVLAGTSKSLSATLNASGSDVTITSATSSSPEFTLSGMSFPFTITAGQGLVITMTFAPQDSGVASASASFASDAGNSPTAEALTGNGTAPVSHTVDLTWSSNGSGITGFNIYRGGTTGGPYTKINAESDANTNYTDSSVQNGQTYCYVTTAVNTEGVESAYSAEVQVVIPAP